MNTYITLLPKLRTSVCAASPKHVLTIAALLFASVTSHAQASITENQSTKLYVTTSGIDSSAGTQTAPLKTIQAAVTKAAGLISKGTGVKIEVGPGTYRESVVIGSSTSSAVLTLEGTTTGGAIISGSDVLTGWSQSGSIYAHSWTAQAACSIPSGWPAASILPIVQRTEQFFVNGRPLTQVLSYGDLKAGTFYVNSASSVVNIFPPAGTNMATAVIEGANRASTLSVNSHNNLVLRGLVLQNAANCFNTSSASINSSANVLVDRVQANWNNWGGLGVYSSTNVTVQNSVANYNGAVGFSGNRDQNVLLQFNESDYNNWRGAQGAFYDWAQGGTKYFASRGITVNNHYSFNNLAQGLWFDTDNKNIEINGATLSGNVMPALQIERNEGPITLENSKLCSSGVGVNVLTSRDLTVKNNLFYNNGATNKYQAQFYLAGQNGGINITDWQTGQVYSLLTTNTALTGNTFADAAAGQLVFGTYLSGNDWSSFTSTLLSDNNTWYDPNTASAFKIVNGKLVNLGTWQTTLGVDKSSTWTPPAASQINACAAPSPTYTDFAVTVDALKYTMAAGNATATARVLSYGYGPVNLSISGLPAGVSAGFSSNGMTSGPSTITFAATSAAVNQTIPVTLWAVSGSRTHSVTFNLVVVHP
jgi:hypothetical protein